MPHDPTLPSGWSTYTVERWSKDDARIVEELMRTKDRDEAQAAFDEVVKRRPRGRYTLRQASLVLAKHPAETQKGPRPGRTGARARMTS